MDDDAACAKLGGRVDRMLHSVDGEDPVGLVGRRQPVAPAGADAALVDGDRTGGVQAGDLEVALPGQRHSNRMISDYSAADRFVMGLLRASADAVLVGADTMREAPGTLWTADQAHPPASELFDELRRRRERPPRPTVAVLSGHGTVDPGHPAFEEGALVLTSEVGAARLRNKLPQASTTVTLGPEPHLDPAAAVAALRSRGHSLILCEGGPTVFGALLVAGLVDELFLTTSPLLAGRPEGEWRPALVEGVELLPATTVSCDLLTLKHSGSQLLARYRCRVSSWDRGHGNPS